MLVLLALFLCPSAVVATPSVYACPFTMLAPRIGFDFTGGEECGAGSFLHYYACCDDNIFQCCFHFETWTIVVFSIVVVAIIASILFYFGRVLVKSH